MVFENVNQAFKNVKMCIKENSEHVFKKILILYLKTINQAFEKY